MFCHTGSKYDFAFFNNNEMLRSPITTNWNQRQRDLATCRIFGNSFHSIVALASPSTKYYLHQTISRTYLKAFRLTKADLVEYGGKPLREYIPTAPVDVKGLCQWLGQMQPQQQQQQQQQ